jgi:hypothetical protein
MTVALPAIVRGSGAVASLKTQSSLQTYKQLQGFKSASVQMRAGPTALMAEEQVHDGDTHVPVTLADVLTGPIATRSITSQWKDYGTAVIEAHFRLRDLSRTLRPFPL